MAKQINSLVIVLVACLVITAEADGEAHCTHKCKQCIAVSESFKRVQCKMTCLAFSGGANNPFDCGNVNPTPPAALKQEITTFMETILGHFTANQGTQMLNMVDADYKFVPVGANPVLGKDKITQLYQDWRDLNTVDEQSESVDITNCGENDGYVWGYGVAYGYSQPNQQGTKVEMHKVHSLLKRQADNSLKLSLEVFS